MISGHVTGIATIMATGARKEVIASTFSPLAIVSINCLVSIHAILYSSTLTGCA